MIFGGGQLGVRGESADPGVSILLKPHQGGVLEQQSILTVYKSYKTLRSLVWTEDAVTPTKQGGKVYKIHCE